MRTGQAHIKQERSYHEGHSLTVSHFVIIQAVSFHDIEKVVLSHASFIVKVFVRWKGTIQVSQNGFLVRRRQSQELRISCFQIWIFRC